MSKIIEQFLKYKKEIIIGTIIFVIIFSSYIFIKLNNKPKQVEESFIIEETFKTEAIEPAEESLIGVDIKGEIVNPGVYLVSNSLRINDIITLAGGLTNQADDRVINLAKKVFDEMVIIIYSKEETANMIQVLANDKEKNETCLNYQDIITNDACTETSKKENIVDKININTASKESLMTLTGIGESKAVSIINYREEKGLFKTIEDIMNVTGIGEAVFAKIKDSITI